MRRSGMWILAAVCLGAALAGCASVLGLEERELAASDAGVTTRADSGTDDDDDFAGDDDDDTAPVDGGTEAQASGACTEELVTVYELRGDSGVNTLYRYQRADAFEDFTKGVPVFRLPAAPSGDATKKLRLIREPTTGDMSISPLPSEDTYVEVETLGYAYSTVTRPPGAISVFRQRQDDPLRHRMAFVKDEEPQWHDDAKEYFVCPLP